jgi:hypothetical protein
MAAGNKAPDPEALTRGQKHWIDILKYQNANTNTSLEPEPTPPLAPPNAPQPSNHGLAWEMAIILALSAAFALVNKDRTKPAPSRLLFMATRKGWGATQARRQWWHRWQNAIFEAKAGVRRLRRPSPAGITCVPPPDRRHPQGEFDGEW